MNKKDINNMPLKEFLERMKWTMEDKDDYDFYFEGRGDGKVSAIIQDKKVYIIGTQNKSRIRSC